jgi:predicted DNA-binding transcriptional regulator AlpA
MDTAFNERLVRDPECHHRVGLSKTQRDDAEARGEFPRRVRITPGGRAVAWLESELLAWLI